ncbi:MAG: T9SS type A sorting domain-containing protein [Bacteroidales bacterium]|nr:T9SS type A sorting domain-containing protein [Bacteroidales bacterium]
MKSFTSLLALCLVLGTSSLFGQTDYICSFSANVEMDSIQVKNTVSEESKMLYSPDNTITLRQNKQQGSEETAITAISNAKFLQQIGNNTVIVTATKPALLNLTLYSTDGKAVTYYSENINIGQHAFKIEAKAGVYVLVATSQNHSSSIKISLPENSPIGISPIATPPSVSQLKSMDDVITFDEGDEFEVTGYYKTQTDVQSIIITENKEVTFSFIEETPLSIKENGAIKAAFSVGKNKKVYFSQGNLQYQASTGTWRFAENQWNFVGKCKSTQYYPNQPQDTGNVFVDGVRCENENVSPTYNGWIDLFSWGTSGWESGAKAYQPYDTSTVKGDYYQGGASGNAANIDWGVYNPISNGGNEAGLWRLPTITEWEYVLTMRTNASEKKGTATVNGVKGLILLPDEWTLPDDITFTSGLENNNFRNCTYTADEWTKMEGNGAVFLPLAGYRRGVTIIRNYGQYFSSSYSEYGIEHLKFSESLCNFVASFLSLEVAISVRLVQEVE